MATHWKVPASDIARDVGALVCLLASLRTPWDFATTTHTYPWVILSALPAALALAVPYTGLVLPTMVTARRARVVKRVLVVPILVCVAVVVINEFNHLHTFLTGGIGVGAALGLAAALLVVQPRQFDESTKETAGWRAGANVAAVLALGATLIGPLVFAVVGDGGFDLLTTLHMSGLGMIVAVIAPPVVGIMLGRSAWRPVLAVVGFGILAVTPFGDIDGPILASPEKWTYPRTGTWMVGAAAALAVCRGLGPTSAATAPRQPIQAAGRLGMFVASAALAVITLNGAWRMSQGAHPSDFSTAMMFWGGAALLSLVGVFVLNQAMRIAFIPCCCVAALAILAFQLANSPPTMVMQVAPIDIAGSVILPAFVAVAALILRDPRSPKGGAASTATPPPADEQIS